MSYQRELLSYLANIIIFKDINVKELLLADSTINPDGTREITYDEAKSSSITGAILKAAINPSDNNTDIVSFEELRYFTGLNKIATDTFKGCSNLKDIRFPSVFGQALDNNILSGAAVEVLHLEGFTSLVSQVINYTSNSKFGYLPDLTEVWIPDLESLQGVCFSSTQQPNVAKIIISSVEQWLKIQIVNQAGNVLPSVGGNASLYLTSDLEHPVTTITTLSQAIPNVTTVPTVFAYSLAGLKNITSITIGAQNTAVEKGAFSNLPNTVTVSNFGYITAVDESSFRNCKAMGTETFPTGIITVKEHSFSNSALTKVESDALKDIQDMYTFYSSPITSVKIDNCDLANSGSRPPQGSFEACTSLTEISANSMPYIPASILKNCSALTTASFTSATRIKYNAFFQCSKLTTLNAPNITYIEHDAFYECLALENTGLNFNLGNVVSIGQLAFKGCSEITCPCVFYNLNFIGENAFGGAKSPTEKYVVFKYQGVVQYELGQQQLYALGTFGTVGGYITAIYVPDGNLTIDGVTKTYLQWYQEDAFWSEYVSRNNLTLDVESNIPT